MNPYKTKLSHIYIFLLLFFISLFSCSDENDPLIPDKPDDPEIVIDPVNKLISPTNNYTIDLKNISTENVEFKWEEPDLKKQTNTYYELVFYKSNVDALDSISRYIVPKSDKNSCTISHKKLDDLCALAGIEEQGSVELIWGVNIVQNKKTIKSKTHHKLNLSRIEVFQVPQNLYLTGLGTERSDVIENAIKFKSLSSNIFELFTRLKQGNDFKLIDNTNIDEIRVFIINKNKLEEASMEDENVMIAKEAPYRISVDFDKMQATIEEVTEFGLFNSIRGYNSIKMGYEADGIWTSEEAGTTGYVLFYHRDWGLEGRYKFEMKLKDSQSGNTKTVHWGKVGTDPYNIEEVEVKSFDNVWGFPEELNQKNIKLKVSLNSEKEYTHSMETYELPKHFWNDIADKSTDSFISAFRLPNGSFKSGVSSSANQYDYWPEAHAMDAVIDAYLRTDNAKYKTYIDAFYEGMLTKNGRDRMFWNEYFDDMAWHALTHMRAYDVTNDQRYEGSSKLLWDYIIAGVLDSGGIPWRNGENQASLVTTAPASMIASRNYNRFGDYKIIKGHTSKEWAVILYNWTRDNHFIPETGRLFEDLNNTQGDWTYHSGTFIGAAIELYKETKNPMYLNDAIKTADYQLTHSIHDGVILSDWAEQEDHDVNLFKGIFIRYLTQLIFVEDLPLEKRNEYVDFIERNAQNLWSSSTIYEPHILYSYAWYHPNYEKQKTWLRAQISGVTLIEAVALLEKEGLLN